MKDYLLLASSSSNTAEETNQSRGTMEAMLAVFKNPAFYIFLGGLVALIVIVYLLRRFVRASANTVVVIVRKGKIRKILSENDRKYYRVPFLDSIGAVVSLNTISITSEKLFINDGPNHLYKFNYTFGYKVVNPETCFLHSEHLQEIVETRINDCLRLFADNGNADILINKYRLCEKDILVAINGAIGDLGIEASSFKVNYIEPLGK